ncbi:MAG: hypothetical protein WC294_06055 [Methanoregula sp.]|jgi:hypothetical protein
MEGKPNNKIQRGGTGNIEIRLESAIKKIGGSMTDKELIQRRIELKKEAIKLMELEIKVLESMLEKMRG